MAHTSAAQHSTPTDIGSVTAAQGWVKADDHLTHVQALARQLVRHLGESGARKTCQDNHWHGVLSVIDRLD